MNTPMASPPESASCSTFIAVHRGRLLYIIVNDRTVFDAIALPAMDHAAAADDGRPHCLSKTTECTTEGLTIIFQHWPHRAKAAAVPDEGGTA